MDLEDIGNYYGAGTWGLNWHENQFDLRMKPGRAEGDSVKLIQPEKSGRSLTGSTN